jgi:hypothetical protein
MGLRKQSRLGGAGRGQKVNVRGERATRRAVRSGGRARADGDLRELAEEAGRLAVALLEVDDVGSR